MSGTPSPGARFRAALARERPLQIVGTVHANHALLARRAGYRAIYLSGGGVSAGSLGLPACAAWSRPAPPPGTSRTRPAPSAAGIGFVVIARTDAIAVDRVEAAIDRARACVEAGADGGICSELACATRFAPCANSLSARAGNRV